MALAAELTHFINVRLTVRGTRFATPVAGSAVNIDLGHLNAGASVSRDVKFNAEARLPNGFFSWPAEEYARVTVTADFDIVNYFRRASQTRVFFTQIEA